MGRERQHELEGIFGRLLGRALLVTTSEDGTSIDGVCLVNLKDDQLALLLLCEIGHGKCDLCVETSFSFSRWWSQTVLVPS